jgi:hypothetical protein
MVRKFTEDVRCKALQHGTLDPSWEVNNTQFCHTHYMSYIVRGTESSADTSSFKRRRESMQDEVYGAIWFSCSIGLTNRFIGSVRSMARIFTKEKRKRKQNRFMSGRHSGLTYSQRIVTLRLSEHA